MIKFAYEYTLTFNDGVVVTTIRYKKQKNTVLIETYKRNGEIPKITMKTVAVNEAETHPHKYHSENRRKEKKAWNKAVRNNRVWIMY